MVLGLEFFQSRSNDCYNQNFSHTRLYMMELVIAPFYSRATNAPVKTTRKDLELDVSLALKIVLFILSVGNLLSTYCIARHWVKADYIIVNIIIKIFRLCFLCLWLFCLIFLIIYFYSIFLKY